MCDITTSVQVVVTLLDPLQEGSPVTAAALTVLEQLVVHARHLLGDKLKTLPPFPQAVEGLGKFQGSLPVMKLPCCRPEAGITTLASLIAMGDAEYSNTMHGIEAAGCMPALTVTPASTQLHIYQSHHGLAALPPQARFCDQKLSRLQSHVSPPRVTLLQVLG